MLTAIKTGYTSFV